MPEDFQKSLPQVLLSAYPGKGDREFFASDGIGENLGALAQPPSREITADPNLDRMTRKLTEWAEARDELDKLVAVLRKAMPESVEVEAIWNKFSNPDALPAITPTSPSMNATETPIPFVLPQIDLSTFTGRTEELLRMEALLLKKQGKKRCRILGLVGDSGVGKSSLACRFATIYRDEFPDGVIGLRVDGKDVSNLAREFAREAGVAIDPENNLDAGAVMREVFARRRMLLIFDGVREAKLKVLLPKGESCAVIVTTQNRNLLASFGIPQKAILELAPPLETMTETVTETTTGNASQARNSSATDDVRSDRSARSGKQDDLKNLEIGLRNLAIELNALGVLLRERGQLAAAQHCFERQVQIGKTLNDLKQLAIGLNALGVLLQKQGQWAIAQQCFERQIQIGEQIDDLKQLAIGLNALGGLLQKQGQLALAQQCFERQIQVSEELNDSNGLAIGLNTLGNLLQKQGQLAAARQCFERRVRTSEEIGDLNGLAVGLNTLGSLLQKQGQLAAAQECFERRIQISEELDDSNGLSIGLNALGGLLQERGQLAAAQHCFERQIQICEELGDSKSLAIGLNALGGLLQKRGQLAAAQQRFKRQIQICEKLGDLKSLAIGLNTLGGLLQKRGQLAIAQQHFERQIQICEELNDLQQLAIGLNALGGLLRERGKFAEAQQYFEWQIQVSRDLKNLKELEMGLHSLGKVQSLQKQWSQAEQTLRQALDIAIQLENTKGQAIICNTLGQICSKQPGPDKLQQALMYFRKSLELNETLQDRTNLAKAYTAMGEAYLSRQDFENAVTALTRGFYLDATHQNQRGLEIVTPQLTYALTQLRRKERAVGYCRRALGIFPHSKALQRLQEKLSAPTFLLSGTIKFIKRKDNGERWGFIIPDRPLEENREIYFRERFLANVNFDVLRSGSPVEVETRKTDRGWVAVSLHELR